MTHPTITKARAALARIEQPVDAAPADAFDTWLASMPTEPRALVSWANRMPSFNDGLKPTEPETLYKDAPRSDLIYARNDNALIGPVSDDDDEGLSEEDRAAFATLGDVADIAGDLAQSAGSAIGVIERQTGDEIAQLHARIDALVDVVGALEARLAELEANGNMDAE